MTFRMDATFDLTPFEQIDRTARDAPKLLQTALKRQQGRLRTRILKQLRKTPGRPHYPLRWKSERQRRAFFATNGFGGGIPYARTGKLEAGWDARFTFSGDGGSFVVENDTPYARYVVGYDQQPFHEGRWVYAPSVVDSFAPMVLDTFEQTWFTVTDPTAGVR